MGEQDRTISRRTLLSAAAVGGVAASVGAGEPAAVAGPHRPVKPISMAMHIHASFSEGVGSFSTHLDQARKHGVDVIWWTDHDFRVAAADHRRAIHFNGASEPEDPGALAWNWTKSTTGTLASNSVAFVADPHSPDDPPTALRLAATGGETAGGTLWYLGRPWNFSVNQAIGDTTIELDVLPEQAGPEAVLAFQIDLSWHPARGGRPAGQYILRYQVGGVSEPTHTASGLLGIVHLPAAAGSWTRLTLRLADDVHRLWPDLVAGDNTLRNVRLGVIAGTAAQGSFVVDRLLFHRSRRAGQAGEDLRAEVIDAYRPSYPDVAHYRSYEVSLVRHLNWYGGDQTLPAFPSPPLRDNDPDVTQAMVDWLHEHGGIVCWNHPLDVETRDSLVKLMIERNNLRCELMEIGRDPFPDLLWVFDVSARNAIFFTAVGASDDHDGKDWLVQTERWLSYAWAESTEERDLVEALRRGRAWFTDPAAYRGAMDISVCGRPAMGGVAITRSGQLPVEVRAEDLPEGSSLEIITGVVDLAGTADLTPSTTSQLIPAADLVDGRHCLRVTVGDGVYLRTQVRGADNAVIGNSNAVWLLRSAPAHGIPDCRRIFLPFGM